MAPITLPAEFGYVGLVVAATFFTNFWHMMRIGSLRKKYEIKYPAMTSDKHEDFMRAQRVHQNNLEQLPFFYVNLVCVCQIGSRSFRCRKYNLKCCCTEWRSSFVFVRLFEDIGHRMHRRNNQRLLVASTNEYGRDEQDLPSTTFQFISPKGSDQ